jgi:hypothetical protein
MRALRKTTARRSLLSCFSSPTANNGATLVAANSEIQIPQASWFNFDEEQGAEKLLLVWFGERDTGVGCSKRVCWRKGAKELIDNPDSNRAVEALNQTLCTEAIVEKSSDRKQTTVRASGDLLVQLLKLEH